MTEIFLESLIKGFSFTFIFTLLFCLIWYIYVKTINKRKDWICSI